MGKRTKYPGYATGSVTINGNTISTSKKDKNNMISSSYNMSGTEKDIYDKVQSGLSSSLSNLFNISDEKQQLWNQQLDAYKRNGIENINDIYEPMETNLKNDIASRFGNFDNSIFMDNLNNISENKAKAVANLSDSLLMKQDQLYSNEIANRVNYINLLSGLNNSINANMINYMSLANGNSSSGNAYNNQMYNAQQANSQNWWNTAGQIAQGAGKIALGVATGGTSLAIDGALTAASSFL